MHMHYYMLPSVSRVFKRLACVSPALHDLLVMMHFDPFVASRPLFFCALLLLYVAAL